MKYNKYLNFLKIKNFIMEKNFFFLSQKILPIFGN